MTLDYKTFTLDEWANFTLYQWAAAFTLDPQDAGLRYYVEAASVFSPGAEATLTFSPGAEASHVFQAGAEETKVIS